MAHKLQSSIWIDRPVSEVFDFTTDFRNWNKFVPSVLDASMEGERGAGATFTLGVQSLGKRFSVGAKWVAYEENASWESHNIDGPVAVQNLQTYHEENGGTRVERVMNVDAKGFFKIAAPVFRRKMQRDLEEEFVSLKDLMESDAA